MKMLEKKSTKNRQQLIDANRVQWGKDRNKAVILRYPNNLVQYNLWMYDG